MDKSRFIAGLIGPTLIAVAVSLFINRDLLPALVDLIARDYALIMIVGVATLLCGLAVVLNHNIWRGWPTVVTVFGWLAVIGGLARILFPRQIAEIAPAMVSAGAGGALIPAIAVLVVGLYLSFMAFRPRPA